jgi:hypothetical protein
MKKTLLILPLLCLLTLIAVGQSNPKSDNLVFSDYYKPSSGMIQPEIFTANEDGFFMVVEEAKSPKVNSPISNKLEIFRYNNQMEEINSTSIALKVGSKKSSFKKIFYYNNKILLFSSLIVNKKTESLYVQTLDPKSLELSKDQNKVLECTQKVRVKDSDKNFIIEKSPDSLTLLVACRHNGGEELKYSLRILDENLNNIHNSIVSFPFKKDEFSIASISINNIGNVIIAGSSTIKGDSGLKIFRYNQGTSSLEKLSVEMDGKSILNSKIIFENNVALIAGYYIEEIGDGIAGSYLLEYSFSDNKFSKIEYQAHRFNARTISVEEMKRGKDRFYPDGYEDLAFDLVNFDKQDDGSYVLIGANSYGAAFKQMNINGELSYLWENNLIITHFTKDHDINWTSRVEKSQMAPYQFIDFLGAIYTYSDESVSFVFNDNKKNLKRKGQKSQLYCFDMDKSSCVSNVILDKNGEEVRTSFFNEPYYLLKPYINVELKDGSKVVYVQYKRKFCFMKLLNK